MELIHGCGLQSSCSAGWDEVTSADCIDRKSLTNEPDRDQDDRALTVIRTDPAGEAHAGTGQG